MPRGKTNGINLGYRVPFVVWFPEKFKHLSPWGDSGVVTDELVSFEDLAPTMISLANGDIPNYLTGRVLLGNSRVKPTDHLVLSADRSDNGIDFKKSEYVNTDNCKGQQRNISEHLFQSKFDLQQQISDARDDRNIR